LDGFELVEGDERFVNWFLGPHPLGGVVPAHAGLVAEADIVDVDEDLVLALLVPHLEPV
jgi:hypothetical protein